jgi:tetratricopeptide (TPR) repeat protein
MTPIPGGFFIEWASPVEIAAIRLDRSLTGPVEIMFDVPSVEFITEMDGRPSPVTSPEMVTALADYWIVRGRPERAIPLYEASLALGNLDDTRAFVFQNNLAMLYSQVLGQHVRALEIVDNALATRRDNVTLLNTKGLIFLNAGRPTEAIPVLQRAVELSCQLPMYCMHLAYALHLEGRPSQARRFFDSARDQLIPLVPNMTPENRAMYDTLHSSYPAIGGSF